MWMCGLTGGQRGENLRGEAGFASALSVSHLSPRLGQEIKSRQPCPQMPLGHAPATMNGLSAALQHASLFNDKFGNVWISSVDRSAVQWCS